MLEATAAPHPSRVSTLGRRFGEEVDRRMPDTFAALADSARHLSGVDLDEEVLRKAVRARVPMPLTYVLPLADALGLQGAERDKFIATGMLARSHPWLVDYVTRLAAAQGIDLRAAVEEVETPVNAATKVEVIAAAV